MAFIGRFFVIVFALLLASLAGSMVVAFGLLGPEWNAFAGDPSQSLGYWVAVSVATGFTAVLGFLPLLIAIALAEAYKVRSLLIHVLAGAGMMLLGYYSVGLIGAQEESIDRAPPLVSRAAEIAIAAGAAFGLVYWAVAGRRAGAWRK